MQEIASAHPDLHARPTRIIVASGQGGDTGVTGRYVAMTMGEMMHHTTPECAVRRVLVYRKWRASSTRVTGIFSKCESAAIVSSV